jgi:hypothetical protein
MELYTRKDPYPDLPLVEVIELITRGDSPEIPLEITPPIRKLMAKSFLYHPEDRPSMTEVVDYFCNHPDFSEGNVQ